MVILSFVTTILLRMIVPLLSASSNCLNRQYPLMLTRIVMIVGSEMDTVVVKKLYSDKFLLEQSSDVGLVKEKFLSTFADFVF